MRLLGVDYGTKRIGLALSDEGGVMAFPHSVVPNDENTLTTLEKIIADEKVQKIVVGHSLDKKGDPNVVHQKVEEFISDLTIRTGLPIELEPEQYTTQEALRLQGRNDMTDASAAALILGSYLSRTKKA